jgi:protease PrsW
MADHVHAPGAPALAGDRSVSRDAVSGALIASRRLWWIVIVVGAAIWLLTAAITWLTEDTILVPTVVILGSFLVPVGMVVFALSRTAEGHLTVEALLLGFLGGGTVGLVFAALTEVYFLPSEYATFFAVGFIEEGCKGIVLVAVAYGLREHAARDGMVLGATVGAGFAAFESSGYALRALLDNSDDHGVLNVVETELSRAILAPFGHITWTALLGGALFAAWQGGAFRVTARVVWTFLGIVALHAAWDASGGWAIMTTKGFLGPGWDIAWPNTQAWIGAPTNDELWVHTSVYWGLIGLNALIGTTWLVRSWRRYASG